MKNLQLKVDGGKLAGMLLITWLCFPGLVGLGNLIFLWADKRYRKRAAIALGLSLGTGLISLILLLSVVGWLLLPFVIWLPLGMAIWMTIDAIKAYETYKEGKEVQS